MLDQLNAARVCHHRPNASGTGQGLPPRLRTMSWVRPGVAPKPHEVETRIRERTLSGVFVGELLSDGAPIGVSENVCVVVAGSGEHLYRDFGELTDTHG